MKRCLCQMEYSSRGSKDTGRDKPRPCLLQEDARQGKGEAKKIDTYQQGGCGWWGRVLGGSREGRVRETN
ncbi:hypothetical protein E2C01_073265 [Portunus trituberculatus]|uniref:Uncharacterized protein n=1 Tax=Portunus trituberculatus TaxID=210409 RepID=A0A5B7ICW1_PORTR|nr:hypothetical protein [Portunus trituberculatus]